MQVVNSNPYVFGDVEDYLRRRFETDQRFANTVFVLGYNIIKEPFNVFKSRYPTDRIIVLNLEQLFDGSPWVNEFTMNWLMAANEVWDYDTENIKFLRSRGIVATYTPFVYTEGLDTYPTVMEKDIDVLFYGMITPRRLTLLSNWMNPTAYKYKTVVVSGVPCTQLGEYIARSKVLLNIHAYDRSYRQEQVRILRPVLNHTCVVSEISNYNHFGQSIVEIRDMRNLRKVLEQVLSTGAWNQIGQDAPEKWKQLTLGK